MKEVIEKLGSAGVELSFVGDRETNYYALFFRASEMEIEELEACRKLARLVAREAGTGIKREYVEVDDEDIVYAVVLSQGGEEK